MPANKRLLFLASDYGSFVSHKAELTRAAIDAGYDVTVAANRHGTAAADLPGVRVIDLAWTRGGSAARAFAKVVSELLEIRRLLGDVSPDVVHAIDLKPSIVAALATHGRRPRLIASINGLGFVFFDRSPAAAGVRFLCGQVLRRAVGRGATVIVQNPDDARVLTESLGVPRNKTQIIRGSGVDPGRYAVSPLPEAHPFRFLIVSRLLFLKGIQDAVAAFAKVRSELGDSVELAIAGAPDAGNPSSIPAETLTAWAAMPGVRLLGQLEDVRPAIAACHVVVQPSLGGEGLPRSLLEAGASGRAMIATNVPGNREIAIDGETGWLTPPADVGGLAATMVRAAADLEGCRARGHAARAKVEREFSVSLIRDQHAAIYRALRESVT
jgi:glycosyltransferase involved in cell wall biosynthesis